MGGFDARATTCSPPGSVLALGRFFCVAMPAFEMPCCGQPWRGMCKGEADLVIQIRRFLVAEWTPPHSMAGVVSKPSQHRGKLIAVEGLDGSGKSTQIYLVKRWLELSGARVFFTEWNSSSLVKPSTIKGKLSRLLTPTTFSLIHATDFADRYERQIFPLLQAGYIVLADRYIFTAFARDVVRGVDFDWVERLYSFAVQPDVTLYFRAPLEVALGRILDGRPELKYHEAGMDLGLSADPYESFRIFQ